MARFTPLRLGIVGAGRAARFLHVPALLRSQDRIQVCAVADPDLESGRLVCSRFHGARLCAEAGELFRAPEIEAVAILTPPATHAELAIRALRAGKHVFIEKPLATSGAEAAEMLRAARESGRCAACGHNLRFHRLVRRAAAAVRDGTLGPLVEIQTEWSSPGSVGSLVWDLGVHHVDLAWFLTSSEFREFRVDEDDLRASATGVLENGARFTARWSREPRVRHTVRLIGTRATAGFSMYSAISWRPRRVFDVFPALAKARAGGDSAESYRLEWTDFAEAMRTGTEPGCSFQEAARNVAVCETKAEARRSAWPEPAPRKTEPALSVVLSVHGAFATVRRTVRHLRAQALRDRIELVLVWAGGDEAAVPAAEVAGFFSCVSEKVPAGAPGGAANAAGVRRASAPVVAFAEDHCFPQAGWAEALVEAHAHGYAAVGPEIVNANPGSVVSWCDYLINYGPWMSPVAAGEAPFLPGHNSSYKRELLLEYGTRLASMLDSETVLHFDLVRRGRRLFVEPRARSKHLNFARWRVWLPVQYHGGRVFAGSRAAGWSRGRKLFYAAASPLIPAVRLWRIVRELLRPERPRRLLPRLLPALTLGLIFDGAGQMAGYLRGTGHSAEHVAAFEHNRVRFIRPEDRRALDDADAHVAS